MKKLHILITLVLLINSLSVFANDVFVVVMQKQEQKKQKRWTLADWMVTKNKIAMMDLWLAMNTSANLFEFYAGGGRGEYDLENALTGAKESKKYDTGELGAYVSILGVELKYNASNEKYSLYSGMLALRLFGTAYQGTNLTVGFGHHVLDMDGDRNYKNNFAQGKFALNLLHFLGAQAVYQKYLKTKANGIEMDGYKTIYGAYLDISFLRIYGNYFEEKLNFTGSPLYTTLKRDGYELGAKLFF